MNDPMHTPKKAEKNDAMIINVAILAMKYFRLAQRYDAHREISMNVIMLWGLRGINH